MKFYICSHCGNIIAYAHNAGVPVMCCGQKMQELVPGSTDAAQEKHVPVITVNGNEVTVKVGDVAHPMQDEHYIGWVALECAKGNQRKELKPGQAPEVKFLLTEDDSVVAAYAYCNLHGLWKSK
jgi:superoxide reductase